MEAKHIEELLAAAKAMDALYVHVWDRSGGGLLVFEENVKKFDDTFCRLHNAIADCEGKPRLVDIDEAMAGEQEID